MELSGIPQYLKNKQKEMSWQRRLQSGLRKKTREGVVLWTQKGMFQGGPSQC